MINKQKFIKLLKLTQSDNNNEVLASIKKANNMLEDSEENWEHLLNNKVDIGDIEDKEIIYLRRDIDRRNILNFEQRREISGLNEIVKFLVIGLVITIGYIIIF